MKAWKIVWVGLTLMGCKDPRADSRDLMRSADALERRMADERKKTDEHLREIDAKNEAVNEAEDRMRTNTDPSKTDQLEAEYVKAIKARSDAAMATAGGPTAGSGGPHRAPCGCNPVDPLCDC